MQSDILQVYITPGLLAGLWEFPSTEVESDSSKDETWQSLLSVFQLPADVKHSHRGMVNTHDTNYPLYLPQPPMIPFPPLSLPPSISCTFPSLTSLDSFLPPSLPPSLPKVVHQFSHLLHHYHVWHITCTVKQKLKVAPAANEPTRWVTHKELMQSAISTAVKKVVANGCRIPLVFSMVLSWPHFQAPLLVFWESGNVTVFCHILFIPLSLKAW